MRRKYFMFLKILIIWFVVSIPVGLFLGKFLSYLDSDDWEDRRD